MAVNYSIFEIMSNFMVKIWRNYKSVIYWSVKFYGIDLVSSFRGLYSDALLNSINNRFLAFLKSRPLFRLFSVFFNQTSQFLQQINVKNVHPVYVTGIWTHNLLIMSLFPYPLDQGFQISCLSTIVNFYSHYKLIVVITLES